MRPIDILEDIFTKQISVLNISVPTMGVTLEEARKYCLSNNYDVHLVRETNGGNLQLYERSTDSVRNLLDQEVISETTPILEVLELLCEHPQAFVKVKRQITRIVSLADLDSIPVRIWLFGMISILEVDLRNKIKATNTQWQQSLSSGRLLKAETLHQLKKNRNEEVELLECIQIVDLSSIILKHLELFQDSYQIYNFENFEENLEKLNKLRDELAHAQKLTLGWKEIFDLMTFTRMIIAT